MYFLDVTQGWTVNVLYGALEHIYLKTCFHVICPANLSSRTKMKNFPSTKKRG